MNRELSNRELAEQSRRLWQVLLLALALSAFINLALFALPIYITQIYTRILPSRSFDTLVSLTLVVLATLAASSLVEQVRASLIHRAAANFESVFVARLAQNIIDYPAIYGSNAEILRDLASVRGFIGGRPCIALLDLPFFPLFIIGLYFIHPIIGLVGTIAAVLVIVLWIMDELATKHVQQQATDLGRKVFVDAERFSQNSATLRSMGMVGPTLAEWDAVYREFLIVNDRALNRSGVFSSIVRFLRVTLQIIVLAFGAWLALKDDLNPGVLVAASVLGSRALAPLEMAIGSWRPFIQARLAFGRIKTAINRTPPEHARHKLQIVSGNVELDKVVYGEAPGAELVIRGMSFTIASGEFLAILGPSGAGKSTLGRLIAGAIDATAGSVRIDGFDLRACDRDTIGVAIGYCAQNMPLVRGTISEVVARLATDPDPELLKQALKASRADDIVADLPKGLDTDVARTFLAPGQAQSIVLARAFYGAPKLLVLDAPTANLDPESERTLVAAIAEAKARGATVVVISPSPQMLRLVDRVLIMRGGRIENLGPRDQVLRPQNSGGRAPPASGQSGTLIPLIG